MDLPSNYGWVLVIDLLLAFECLMVNFGVVGRARSKVFTPEYLNLNYQELFRNELGKAPDKGGYPDMGNGRLSEKLTFAQWYYFNSAQRVAYNFLEQVHFPLVCIAIGGLYYDITTICLGSAYIVARLLYTIGYVVGGPSKRVIGALLGNLISLALMVIALISAFRLQYD